MKRKSLAALLSGLLTVSLTGVGFASWLITGGTVDQTYGNISVETVTDKRCQVSAINVAFDSGTGIVFGPTAAAKTDEDSWIRAASTASTENLGATLTFTVTNAEYITSVTAEIKQIKSAGDDGDYGTSDDVYYESTDADKGTYATAYEAGYVGALPTLTVGAGTVNSITATSKDYTVEFDFTWGTKFGGSNPYTYYKDKSSATYGQEAFDALTALKALDNAKFGIIVTVSVD